jgi:hypothetical protein
MRDSKESAAAELTELKEAVFHLRISDSDPPRPIPYLLMGPKESTPIATRSTNDRTIKYPAVKVQLSGLDNNALAIMGCC